MRTINGTILCLAIAASLSGCQLIQQASYQEQIYDPIEIDGYQLPILIEGVETLSSFRQSQTKGAWFWTLLENDTYLPGENLVIQVFSPAPLEQPPSLFSFTVPSDEGQLTYNAVGAYQRWTKKMASGEQCLFARQNARLNTTWLTVFTRYCTSRANPDFSGVTELTPSFLLEEI